MPTLVPQSPPGHRSPTETRRGLFALFGGAVLTSAFLVFQVQPIISRSVLPWFGGSPAVWTTCLLFFQVLLFAGYAYAHLVSKYLPPAVQGAGHLVLLAVSLCLLPITPHPEWKPLGAEEPTLRILAILLIHVGLPYFVLSATGPLLSAWYCRVLPDRSVYRLYALSNVGSLGALLSYPFWFEPAFSTVWQGRLWSLGFCAFALVCGAIAAGLLKCSAPSDRLIGHPPRRNARPSSRACWRDPSYWRDWARPAAWIAYPAFASVLLLATTNHVCQDVAVVPFLWILPLSLYLLTFIICFECENWYRRRWVGAAAVAAVVALCVVVRFPIEYSLVVEVLAYVGVMFLLMLLCHGELVRTKPAPERLTAFYLSMAAGGALGGVAVALVCPLLFRTYFELNLSLIAGALLAIGVLWHDTFALFADSTRRQLTAAAAALAVFVFVGTTQCDLVHHDAVWQVRNFYGTLRVEQPRAAIGTRLVHGRVVHGFQFTSERLATVPTTYYTKESGVGRAFQRLAARPRLRVGVVGLGCGTLAAYGRSGDYFRFYELNPTVLAIARQWFSFLDRCPAAVDVVLGDARLSLEREPAQQFDLLVLDAFSGDSVPTHLLTREALAEYRRHLRPGGLIAIHVSNRHLDLEPVVRGLADSFQMACARLENSEIPPVMRLASTWMLVTDDPALLAGDPPASRTSARANPLWTDQQHSLLQLLRIH